MKPWVLILLTVVGGYLLYQWWFAPEEQPPETVPMLQVEPDPPPAEPGAGTALPEPVPSRLPLDLEGGEAAPSVARRNEAAWELERERRTALEKGDEAAAQRAGARLVEEHPDSDPARLVLFERGRELLAMYRREGRNKEGLQHAAEARKLLTPALFLSDVDAAERTRLRDTLRELADDVLFSGRHVEGVDFLYTPQSGDYLAKLCRKVFPARGAWVSPGFVCSVNSLPSPKHLRAREPIKVPLGKPSIVVVKSEFRLYFLLDGAYVRDFPVGLGKKGSTPEAAFQIELMQEKPDWYPEPGKRIRYGDPANILGTRWMGFRNSPEYRGFGIHGTSDPSSIGREESSGCIRMRQNDVELLYSWTPLHTTVLIRR